MTFVRYTTGAHGGGSEPGAQAGSAHVEERRATRSSRLAAGTLACARCDAPVAIGALTLSPGERLTCPFCSHRAPVRDFLSLASPTRPARVVVRVRRTKTSR
ncbi:MAG: hypothetical protein M3Z06_06175 [Actinomycetota bacterium]|nr:hypothetical protein [Actinomycetota bacterium]